MEHDQSSYFCRGPDDFCWGPAPVGPTLVTGPMTYLLSVNLRTSCLPNAVNSTIRSSQCPVCMQYTSINSSGLLCLLIYNEKGNHKIWTCITLINSAKMIRMTMADLNRWRNMYSVGLATNRSWVQILFGAKLRNNLRQVVHTLVPHQGEVML